MHGCAGRSLRNRCLQRRGIGESGGLEPVLLDAKQSDGRGSRIGRREPDLPQALRRPVAQARTGERTFKGGEVRCRGACSTRLLSVTSRMKIAMPPVVVGYAVTLVHISSGTKCSSNRTGVLVHCLFKRNIELPLSPPRWQKPQRAHAQGRQHSGEPSGGP